MKVDNEVIAVLDRALIRGNSIFLVGQLDRRLYERTNKVLEAAGGKWNRKAKAHIFASDASDAIENIILTGEITVPQDVGFFPTPAAIVKRLLEVADIQPGMEVLEPSAGQGSIALAVSRLRATVDCIEFLWKYAEAIHAAGFARDLHVGDFLTVEPKPIYDRVVMNPPFGRQADIKHVAHALRFLKPDGLLVSVMSAGITFRSNSLTNNFRDLIRGCGGSIEALQEGAFREAGTNVNAVIVIIPAKKQE